MRSQSAVFVDAGYLIAAAATRVTGSSFRRGVNVDYEKLVAEIITLVEDRTGLPLLRVYWYDAGRNGNPDSDQAKIAELPKVKLRLGMIGVNGEQKGVDLRIGLDMVGHSRGGAVDIIYLLSGDDDLTEAVDEAQAQGVQVVILAVRAASGGLHGVSRHLIRAADDVEILPDELVEASVTAVVTAPPAPSPVPVPPHVTGIAAVAAAPRPKTPLDLVPRRTPSSAPVPIATFAYSGSTGSKAYIAPEYQHDPDVVTTAIVGVVEKAYDAWSHAATPEQREALRTERPTIPRELDRALLVDLAVVLNDYDLSDEVRRELRARFWDTVTPA